ncbi:hypothetical protein [Caballeronia sp. GAFFF2]|uniref:hypothetical protein n=1 Tax=Caballeronia sp. GAFFF2 TaxID=2921741 RepID=UPI002029265B|nr:hypothetical protein [Caballeronia sp. GAFFF2]
MNRGDAVGASARRSRFVGDRRVDDVSRDRFDDGFVRFGATKLICAGGCRGALAEDRRADKAGNLLLYITQISKLFVCSGNILMSCSGAAAII